MLIVRVELHSAITGRVTELARMRIYNDGNGSRDRGNYVAETYRGRDSDALSESMANKITNRKGNVENWPRLQKHVWFLVERCLASMGYDK